MARMFVALAGALVGFVVGLTGMGGGALMTPIMVLVFGVQPLAAVSSDLVASLVMKPVGASVHMRHGAVNRRLAAFLCIGSVPAAFCGVLILKAFDTGADFQERVKLMLGVALLLAATSMVVKNVVDARRGRVTSNKVDSIHVRPLPTILIGLFGGLMVGLTSVGSGSLIIVLLLLLYPMLSAKSLVGTDLVQAIPLVGAAALGHLLFGDFKLGLTATLLAGAIPGVYVGARVSTKAPDHIIRPVLVMVLYISALKLLGVSTGYLGLAIIGGIAILAGLLVRARLIAIGEAQASAPLPEAITEPSSTPVEPPNAPETGEKTPS
jgi:uncharacterized membrane protein YfcA